MVLDLAGWLGVFPIVGAAVGLAMSAVLLLSRPDLAQNRYLVLFFSTLELGFALNNGARGLLDDPALVYAAGVTARVAWPLAALGAVLFLSTLDTPLTRPLAKRPVKVGAAVIHGLLSLSALLVPTLWIAGVVDSTALPGYQQFVDGPWIAPWEIYTLGLILYFTAAMVVAYRRTEGALARRKMWYMTVGLVGLALIEFAWLSALFVLEFFRSTAEVPQILLGQLGPPTQTIFGHAFLAYGILTTQLFDIDLKLKHGIRHSTLAALFVAVVLVVTEGVQQLFAGAGGLGPWIGIGAAAVLVLVLAPLQRFAEKVSDAAMPNVKETDEYLTFRKHEVFRHAVEEAVEDGTISEKERRVLAALKTDLAIGDDVAERLEADVLGAAGGTS